MFVTLIVKFICHKMFNVDTCYQLNSGGIKAQAQGWETDPCSQLVKAGAKEVVTRDYGIIDFWHIQGYNQGQK